MFGKGPPGGNSRRLCDLILRASHYGEHLNVRRAGPVGA